MDYLCKNYKDELRYSQEDGWEIAIVDPSKNNELVGFYCKGVPLRYHTFYFSSTAYSFLLTELEADMGIFAFNRDKRLRRYGFRAVKVRRDVKITFFE